MRSIILMLSVCSLLCITDLAQAGLPEADAMLTRAAAFQQWGERLYRKGDTTAAEAAFYEAGKLEAEAAELELVEVDQRAYPVIQQLSLIVEERFDRLGEAQSEVGSRLQALEEKLTKRLESSGEGLRIDLHDLSGNLEDLSSEARKALGKLQSEFTELTDQLFVDRGSDREDAEEEDREKCNKRRGRERETSDRERSRRMHIHAAMHNLSAPPIHHHMRESIKHLHAAGLHDAAKQLERALDAAREQVKEALGDSGGHERGHHSHHRGHDGDRSGDRHHDGDHRAHHSGDRDHDHHAHHSGDRHRDGDRHAHHSGGRHHDHHAHRSGDRDGDEGHRPHHKAHHPHPSGPDRSSADNKKSQEHLERLTRHVRELTERVEKLENATKKKKKSRDKD